MSIDINSISQDDVDKMTETEVETGSSEPETTEEVTSSASEETTAPASDENVGAGSDENTDGTETKGASNTSTAKPAKSLSRIDRAEYSAAKWKKKFKAMKRERDEMAQEFNKYKDFNPNNFSSAQDAHEFMAWKASTNQRLKDMDADMRSFYNEKRGEEYEGKINSCFTNERSVDEYHDLDNEWAESFDVACQMYDPDNVISDFVENSKYEPALKTVIYKNPKLQDELFKEYSNSKIGNIRRMQILESLERQVDAFYKNGGQTATQKAASAKPASAPARRYSLPARGGSVRTTGSLTKGNDVGKPDDDAIVAQAYHAIYGK